MRLNKGDGVTYIAELIYFNKHYHRVEVMTNMRESHGYIYEKIHPEIYRIWNGVRFVMVHEKDIIKNHALTVHIHK